MTIRKYSIEYESIINGELVKFIVGDLSDRIQIEETLVKVLSEYPRNTNRHSFKLNILYGDKKRQINICVPNADDKETIEALLHGDTALKWAEIKSLELRDVLYLSEKELEEKELVL